MGYIRNKRRKTVVIPGYEHCYCKALLNYSGKLKLKKSGRKSSAYSRI